MLVIPRASHTFGYIWAEWRWVSIPGASCFGATKIVRIACWDGCHRDVSWVFHMEHAGMHQILLILIHPLPPLVLFQAVRDVWNLHPCGIFRCFFAGLPDSYQGILTRNFLLNQKWIVLGFWSTGFVWLPACKQPPAPSFPCHAIKAMQQFGCFKYGCVSLLVNSGKSLGR